MFRNLARRSTSQGVSIPAASAIHSCDIFKISKPIYRLAQILPMFVTLAFSQVSILTTNVVCESFRGPKWTDCSKDSCFYICFLWFAHRHSELNFSQNENRRNSVPWIGVVLPCIRRQIQYECRKLPNTYETKSLSKLRRFPGAYTQYKSLKVSWILGVSDFASFRTPTHIDK